MVNLLWNNFHWFSFLHFWLLVSLVSRECSCCRYSINWQRQSRWSTIFAPVVHSATAGGHQQSTAGLLSVGQMTPPLVSDRGSVGRRQVTSATYWAWSVCGCHGELACCWYMVTEVAGLGRRRRSVIQATAMEKGAFEFAAEFPCWKNDKFEQYDATYIVQALDPRVCRYKYMTTHVESLNQYEFSYKVPTIYRTVVQNVQPTLMLKVSALCPRRRATWLLG